LTITANRPGGKTAGLLTVPASRVNAAESNQLRNAARRLNRRSINRSGKPRERG